MLERACLEAKIRGRVQGVYFRAFVQQHARRLGLTGYVRNLADGNSVEVRAEGEREHLEELLSLLQVGPRGAMVSEVETKWSAPEDTFQDFRVRY